MKTIKIAGFSLVEVIVVMAILAILGVGFAGMMAQIMKSRKYLDVSIEYNRFLFELQTSLSHNDRCKDIFAGNVFGIVAGVKKDVNLTLNGFTYIPAVDPWMYNNPASGVKITEITLANSAIPFQKIRIANPALPTAVINATRFYATLSVTPAIQVEGPALRSRDFNISIIVAGAGIAGPILGCSAEQSSSTACIEMGGTYDATKTDPSDRCDISPSFGGCISGGGYSKKDGVCEEENPATSACSCPAGFTADMSLDFLAVDGKGSAAMELYSCVKCTP